MSRSSPPHQDDGSTKDSLADMPALKAPASGDGKWESELSNLEASVRRLRGKLAERFHQINQDAAAVGEARAQLRTARDEIEALKKARDATDRSSEMLADELAQARKDHIRAEERWAQENAQLRKELELAKVMLGNALSGGTPESHLVRKSALRATAQSSVSPPIASARVERASRTTPTAETVRPPSRATANGDE